MAPNGPRATRQREPGWRKEGDLAGPISPEAIETQLYLNSTAQPRSLVDLVVYIPQQCSGITIEE